MPTYEYACSSCQHDWEFEQSIKDSPITECPSCHQQTARRQISKGTGFILKGSGWYADLYSGSSNKAAPTESKSADSSEAKPAAGAESKGGGDTSKGGGDTTSTASSGEAKPSPAAAAA